MTNEVSAPNEYIKHLAAIQGQFNEIAPPTMRWEAEKGYALQLLEANPQLMEAARKNPISLAQSIRNVAALQLSLNPVKKEAYLISRTVKVGNQWVPRVCLEPSYMGMCNVATGTGRIKWIQAIVVYSKDTFVDNGPGEKPTHEYDAFSTDRGEYVGVYATAKTDDGDYLTTIMRKDEIDSIRARSESFKKNFGPWITDYFEQAKKTVVRRMFKMLPKTSGMDKIEAAVHLSNENEGFEPILTEPKTKGFTLDQKQYFDQLIEDSNALGMFVFEASFRDADHGIAAWSNLYHSFPKGKKGHYQKLVESLLTKGREIFETALSNAEEAAANSDTQALEEVIAELSQDELALMLDRGSNELKHFYKEAAKSLAG